MHVAPDSPVTPVAGAAPSKALQQAAKDIESLFLEQLTAELAKSAQPAGNGSSDQTDDSVSSSTDSVSQLYTQMLPDALAQSISASGGIGLAAGIAKSLEAQP